MALYIGLMSGTSMDGIDAALVDFPTNKLMYGITKKYSQETKKLLERVVRQQSAKLSEISALNTLIGKDFAQAVVQLLSDSTYKPEDIVAIGSHGQTLCHDASAAIPYTMQLGCPHTISTVTGIEVVADFRTRDMTNGGQGAPFAPLYHRELLAKVDEAVAVVNIGGIANITVLNGSKTIKGWDVGPGNCLMDKWIMQHLDLQYDEDGGWAAQGTINTPLLDSFLSDPFFKKTVPKSIGTEYFSIEWLKSHIRSSLESQDIQATLAALTALGIAKAIQEEDCSINTLYLCGGGTHNSQLITLLREYLPAVKINSVASVGVDPDYLEAMMFAWLAFKTINRVPVDLRSITGSRNLSILGALYPAIDKLNNNTL